LLGSAFGCASGGGSNGDGGIYQETQNKNGTYSESVIFNFPDSTYPNAIVGEGACSLLQADQAGTLYGVSFGTLNGPPYNFVFQLTPPAAAGGRWTETPLLYFFTDNSDNPTVPTYPIAQIGNNDYVAFETTSGGSQHGAIVELTFTP
jgi:hypothetical protein